MFLKLSGFFLRSGEEFTIYFGDHLNFDLFGAYCLTFVVVGAVAETFMVHLGYYSLDLLLTDGYIVPVEIEFSVGH